MATSPPPLHPGILRLSVNYISSDTSAVNVLYFQCTESAGIVNADVISVATSLGHYWRDDLWKAQAAQDFEIQSYKVLYADVEGAPNVRRATLADGTVGTVVSDPDRAMVAWLINWSSGDPRRGGKPRTYLPGVPESASNDPANVSGAFLTALNAGIVAFLGHIAAVSHGALSVVGLVEYSQRLNNAWRDTATWYGISEGTVNPVFGTQRRRINRARPIA
jgi:hypothetical protein